MKLLLDTCASKSARDYLRLAGHDVFWGGDIPEDPGDLELLRRAHAEGRVIVTLDKDFGELAVHRRERHRGILRLVGFSSQKEGQVAQSALERYAGVLLEGSIVTVEPGRVRVRDPE